jgi:hypothetical protein
MTDSDQARLDRVWDIVDKASVCKAFIAHDPDRARALWNERQKVWWSWPDDPNIRVVRVEPEQAEMWDGPANSAMAALEFAKARLTGKRHQLGENRKVAVDRG